MLSKPLFFWRGRGLDSLTLVAVLGIVCSICHGQGISDSASVWWDAVDHVSGESEWSDFDGVFPWDLGSETSVVGGITNLAGVRTWLSAPQATAPSIDTLGGGLTTEDVSWEVIFSPGSFEENYVVFETGGNGDGTAFVVQDGVLEFRVQDANNEDQRVILYYEFPEESESDFYHVVATVLLGAAEENEVILYVNGAKEDEASALGDLLDWSGNDGAGIGIQNAAISTGQTNLSALPGTISVLRLYQGLVLEEGEIADEFARLSTVDDDTDEDDLSDALENLYFGNLDQTADGDPDGDTLTNLQEQERNTNMNVGDTDGDGYLDDVETNTGIWVGLGDTGTNPLIADGDGDGLPDGVETNSGVFTDITHTGTDPLDPDSDDDDFSDGYEAANGSNPVDPDSIPAGEFPEPTELLLEFAALPTYNDRSNGDLAWDKLDATFIADIDFEAKEDGAAELVWESGGGTVGWSVTYEAPSSLVSRKSGNGGIDVAAITYALSAGDIAAGELQVAWTFQQENEDFEQVISLVIGDRIVATISGDYEPDWSGGNGAAFGVASSSIAAGGDNTSLAASALTSATVNLDKGLRFYSDFLFEPESSDADGDDFEIP